MTPALRHSLYALLGLCLVLGFTACSKQAKKSRYLQRADRYFQAAEFDKAELEYLNVLRLDETDAHAARRLGLLYFEQGKPSQAYPFLKQAVEVDGQDLEVRLKLATVYFAGRRFNDVRQQVDFVLRTQPGHGDALVLLAESARTAGELKSVRQRLEANRRHHETNAAFHVALGLIAIREREPSRAEEAFNRALALEASPLVHSAIANLNAFMGRSAKAAEHYKAAHDLSPPRSPRKLDYIEYQIKLGEITRAKGLLQNLVAQAPDYIPALNRKADLAIRERNYAEAAATLKEIFARDPQNFEALMAQGDILFAEGDLQKAITHYERVRGTYENVPRVHYQLAVASLRLNKTSDAIGQLQRARVLDPNFTEATLLLAELYLRKGDTLSPIALLTELLKKRPDLPQIYHLLGAAYRTRNNLENALDIYRRFSSAFPKAPQGPMLLGSILLLQSKTNLARQEFEKAFALAPAYLPALEALVSLDLDEREPDMAFTRCNQQRERFPNAPELQVLLAKIHFQRRDTNQVELALRKAIELNPNYREPYFLLARMFVERKEHSQAIENLETIIARNPKDRGALMLLGTIHGELKNRPAERATYERLLAIDSRFSPALNNLAYLYSEHFNELEKAYEMAQRARELMPLDPAAADTLGWILLKRRDYAWALSLLQESAEKLQKEPEVAFHLGMAHYMMAHEHEALSSFTRALQSGKDFSGIEEARRCLAVLKTNAKNASDAAIAGLEHQAAARTNDPILLSRLASAYEFKGQLEKAHTAYEQALAINRQSVPLMLQLADFLAAALKQPQRALNLAKDARALAPHDPLVTRALGRLAAQTGQVPDATWAVSLLQGSARQLPDDPGVHFDLANAHFNVGQISDAQDALQTAAKLAKDPADAQSFRRLLSLMGVIKDPQTAPKYSRLIDAALAEQPAAPSALMASALLREQQQQPEAAAQTYHSILDKLPAFIPAHQRLALLYLGPLNDAHKAALHATALRERMPSDSEAAKLLGIADFKRGEYTRSAQLLADSSRSRSSDAELFFYLGLAHYHLDQKPESKKALNQALALNLPSTLAAEARRILPEL